ncbi:MAG: hypothetical protein AAGU19_16035 [Prolixibacteraceae bacterium]
MKKSRIGDLFAKKDHDVNLILSLLTILLFSSFLGSCSRDEELLDNEEKSQIIDPSPSQPSVIYHGTSVIVKADETLSASGKNDIDVIRNYFYSGTLCDDNLTNDPSMPLWPVELKYAEAIGVHGMRAINAERGCSLDANGNFVTSSGLRGALNIIHRHQWDLHLIVAQSKPAALQGDAWNWNAAQWNAYEDYAYKCLNFVMNDHNGGFQQSIIEVANEVDISGKGGYWFAEGTWNNGDLKAYAGYIKAYAQWSDAAKRFNRDFPGKKVRLFGPAITAYTIWFTPMWCKENWALKFIGDAQANNWQFDGLSIHQYGGEMLGERPDYSNGKNPRYRSTLKEMQDKLDRCGFPDTEIWITEWSPSDWFGTDRVKNNYRPAGGAFAAAFMHESVDNGIDGMVPLRLRAPNTDSKWSTIGSLATINKVIYPNPVYNVFRMFNMLPGQRKKLIWKNGNIQLGAIASGTKDAVGLIVYNYDWDNASITDRSVSHEFQVKVAAPTLSGNITVKRFLMDHEHSNVAKYVDAGAIPPLQDVELQQVEEYSVQAVNDTITLAATTLGQSAVSLWLLSK